MCSWQRSISACGQTASRCRMSPVSSIEGVCVCACVLQSWIYCVDAAPHACTPPPHLLPLDPQRHEKMNKKRKKNKEIVCFLCLRSTGNPPSGWLFDDGCVLFFSVPSRTPQPWLHHEKGRGIKGVSAENTPRLGVSHTPFIIFSYRPPQSADIWLTK